MAAALAVTGSRSAITESGPAPSSSATSGSLRGRALHLAGDHPDQPRWWTSMPHYDQPDPMKDAAFTGTPPADPPPTMRPAGPRLRPGSAGRPGVRFKIAR